MAIFNSKLLVYQRVTPVKYVDELCLSHYNWGYNWIMTLTKWDEPTK